ncbi:ubiquitin-like-conjugating enzyme ATG10 [Scaptodrosophila lebanonensis]|uniref:Ubiquitin-like-conjugating enzyme ATG10 n=1 Tax=Drosophila lebanonensis TaxID=7225 RepID=A0A6J2TU87_DROLE|nr:ubiquitin-like-conjugating enzyme ATG10 [Scaptodrosophila lebanonensis]
MVDGTLSWTDFLSEAREFLHLSEQLGDGWTLCEKDGNEPNTFLSCKRKVRSKDNGTLSTLISVEYHVVFSVSYQVPMLFFQAHRSDGSLLDVDATWRAFMPEARERSDLFQMLTQMDHPVLFRPFMALHPCRTSDVLAQFGKKSENRILTFISVYGPHVQLNLQNAYGNAIKCK